MKLSPYPKYKHSSVEWLGDVPVHWEVKRLKFVSLITSSGVWGEEPYPETDGYRVATTANIDMHGNIDVDGITIRSLSKQELSQGVCLPGDIIVVKSSGSATSVISGKAGLVKEEHGLICFSNFTLRVRPSPSVLDARFAWFFLNSEVVRAQIRLMVSTTTYPNLQVGEYASFSLPLPNYREQRTIAEFLERETSKLDALVAAKERLLGLLADKRRALITRAVTRGLNPDVPLRDSGVSWLGQIPEHWETRRIAWLFSDRDERCKPDLPLLEVSINSGVSIREFSSDRIESTAEDFNTYKVARKGDVVFNKMRMWQGAVGVAPEDGLVSPDYTVAAPVGMLLPEYAGLLFRTEMFSAECARYSHGIVWDRLRLYWEGFRDIVVPLPPPAEQRAIVAHISAGAAKLDALRVAAERTIGLLKERRAALIGAAVTGKIESLS